MNAPLGARRFLLIILCGLCGAVPGACQTLPGARRVDLGGADAERVSQALGRWPRTSQGGISKTFFATVHLAGVKAASPGTLMYYGPRDFRITASKPGGEILFDVRMNWAGITVLRIRTTLPRGAVEVLTADIARAFELPRSLEGLRAGKEKMVLEHRGADTNHYHWIFDRADGSLLQTDIDLGLLDTLHIHFREGYSEDGWPREVEFSRPARLYDVMLRFTP